MRTSIPRLRRIRWNPVRVDGLWNTQDFPNWLRQPGLSDYFDWLSANDYTTMTRGHTTEVWSCER